MSLSRKKITIAIVGAIVVIGSFSIVSYYYNKNKAQQGNSKSIELQQDTEEAAANTDIEDTEAVSKEVAQHSVENPENTQETEENQEETELLELEETDNETQEEETESEEPAPKFYMEGVRHSTVEEIQQRLMDLGFMEDSEPTDLYGRITAEAVKSFQRQSDVKQDGILGPETYENLLSENAKHYTLKLGFDGTDVKQLQQRLYEMGYLASADMVTGHFGDVTEAAVKKMQLNNGLYDDGKVGDLTFEMLYSEEIKPNLLSYGEQSDVVLEAQKRLKELGYLTTTPDGKYGNDTVIAVKQFQARNDLVVDGYLGPSTREVLNSSTVTSNGMVLGDSGDAVTRVQELLNKYGYISSANMTGYFGEITEEAVKQFQRNNGLTADGNVGSMTMSKLTGSNVVKANNSSSGSTNSGSSNSNSGSSNNSSGSGNSGSSNSGSNSNSSSSGNSGSSSNSSGSVSSSASALVSIAKSKLGAKYVYGSKGPNSFDCSGFIYWCLNQAGVRQSYLSSSGWANVGKYKRISSLSDVRAGDIIVVRGHVGIAAGNGMVIDASTSEGKIVYRSITSWWTSRFIVAWRIF